MFCAILDNRYLLLYTNFTILRKFTNLIIFIKFTHIAIFTKFTNFKNGRCTLLQILTCIWLLEYILISMDELNIYRNSLGALFTVSFSLSDNTLQVLVVEIGRSGETHFLCIRGKFKFTDFTKMFTMCNNTEKHTGCPLTNLDQINYNTRAFPKFQLN